MRWTRLRISLFGERDDVKMSPEEIEKLRNLGGQKGPVAMVPRDQDRFAKMTPEEHERMLKAGQKHRWLRGLGRLMGMLD